MTFRGSVPTWIDIEEDVGTNAAGADTDANSTNVLLGTQIDFKFWLEAINQKRSAGKSHHFFLIREIPT
jgi:hypothetical protein